MEGTFEAPPGYLTSEQVAEILAVPYRSLMRWVEEGLVVPFTAGGRQRAPRLWAEKHIREARVIKRLRDLGVSMQAIKEAMKYLRSINHNPFSTGEFLVLDHGAEVVKICEGGETLSLLKSPGQGLLLVLDLEEIAKEGTIP